VVVIGGSTVVGLVMMVRTHDFTWLLLSLPFSAMLLVAARYAPRGYWLAPDGLHIERKVGPKVIRYRDIRDVDRGPRSVRGMTFGGSNGLFGRFGRFWSPRLGFYRLFLSNTHAVVWLSTSTGWVGLSPDLPDEFCARLATRLADRPRSS
jgi:Bacterial PH domain